MNPPPWWQPLLANGKVLIFLIVAIFSVLRAIATGLKKKAEERQQRVQRQQRDLEAIRTGRPADANAPSQIAVPQRQPIVPRSSTTGPAPLAATAREQLEALAAKRRAAIEELQRRRAGNGGAVSGPKPTTPQRTVTAVLSAPNPTTRVPTRTPPVNTGRSGSPTPLPLPGGSSTRPTRDRTLRTPPPPPPPPPMPRAIPQSLVTTAPAETVNQAAGQTSGNAVSTAPDSTSSIVTPRADPLGFRAMARGDLKRAILLREVLDPPLSLRS